ncbi:hypothetical protein ACERK3_12935 [Phycisphaerales bacterium AB-hyl4]|uniref:Uncharacterized protein n=1 Tax=Natronomicrosphaera hydrolytica TaxID=3242702 RepID=A0ABV4U6G0_9BACT
MHARARVESVESVRQFRASLWQFAEEARNALSDAASDVQRTLQWLELEQGPWWTKQLRKRHEAVLQAKQALDDKKRYKTVDGTQPAAVEEEQALRVARRRHEEAERRLAAVKHWRRQLDREAMLYHGVSQRLSRAIETGIPNAVATLDRLTDALAAYLALQAPQAQRMPGDAAEDAQGMGLPASLVTDTADESDEAEDDEPTEEAERDAGAAPSMDHGFDDVNEGGGR